MKKLFIIGIGLIMFMLVTCDKKTEKELEKIEKIIKETDNVINEYEKKLSSIEDADQVKDEESIESINVNVEEKINHISFKNETLNTTYTVSFTLFKNQHHPNGYIIIHKIEEIDDDGNEYTLIPVYASNPKDYIENIHDLEGFIIRTPEGNKDLTDIIVQNIFRTGEAMVMSVLQSTTDFPYNYEAAVDLDYLKESASRMKGRKYGSSISD